MATVFFARELINFLLFSPAKGLRRGAQLLGETKRVNGRSRCRHRRIRGRLHDDRKVRGKGCCVVIPGVCSWHLPSGARAPFPFHLDLHFLRRSREGYRHQYSYIHITIDISIHIFTSPSKINTIFLIHSHHVNPRATDVGRPG